MLNDKLQLPHGFVRRAPSLISGRFVTLSGAREVLWWFQLVAVSCRFPLTREAPDGRLYEHLPPALPFTVLKPSLFFDVPHLLKTAHLTLLFGTPWHGSVLLIRF